MTIGKAYAFFDCNASKKEIETELPTIRELVKTPSKLELFLAEGVENLNYGEDVKLKEIVNRAKNDGMKYVMEAKYAGATNKQTADEVAGILNQAYQSPLYKDKEQFSGEIVYENKGKYIFRE
jgi:hypothetical protein